MKTSTLWISLLCLAMALTLVPATLAQTNSVRVTSAAAMGNSVAQNTCTGDGQPGPCGLEMIYQPGQTNRARVVKFDFGVESVFRERFWMDLNNFVGTSFTRNFFHTISGNFPRNEPGSTLLPTYRTDLVRKGATYAIGAGAFDNQRNRVGLTRCPVPADSPFEIQIEWTAGCAPTRGIFKLTIFESGVATCTRQAEVQNCALNVNRLNFETLVEGGVDAPSTLYIDEYTSFRTLAP